MATTTEKKAAIKGGEFLIRETEAHEIFIPEEFNEEQKMIQQQCKDFLQKEIFNRLDEIDSMKDPKANAIVCWTRRASSAYWVHLFLQSTVGLEWILIRPCWWRKLLVPDIPLRLLYLHIPG